ncbi:phosphoenolpyruvate synthase [Thiomicrospira aerophila AL3]|uniref:Phosphoenolpyruvate synthase n=1 Tax=Thiomicrospira aerophila AL3 TaxID=717772 RepID=W0DQ78_9GAMM|nr:phosphoenolpyruvate synthase [Thiomicrospira aerophila]AHF00740.1 phosphoenolpyruvate synthase [Thiomicrospira aerophila AL3]
MSVNYIRFFSELTLDDLPLVGGKNASLGEMVQALASQGVPVPEGFAVTAEAYRELLSVNKLTGKISAEMQALNPDDKDDLATRAKRVRGWIYDAKWPADMISQLHQAYGRLQAESGLGDQLSLAVRSSATAEDLPNASFAGQQDTYLNIQGEADLLEACKRCFASLYTDRAIHYRIDKGFDHDQVALSIGVQRMVRSDLASSGVIFTLDTETGFDQVVFITAAWGLGENVVQGAVDPDEFYVHKPTLAQGFEQVLKRHKGAKKIKMVYASAAAKSPVRNVPTSRAEREVFCLSDADVVTLARYAMIIEQHYSAQAGYTKPMDIEWAKDGLTGELFIVQARPETVISQKNKAIQRDYRLAAPPEFAPLVIGRAVGGKIGQGQVRVIKDLSELSSFKRGEILVSDTTNPDWEPIMKMAGAIVTNRGGRTCHAAIIARELGIPAVVGCEHATEHLTSGMDVTVSCAEGEQGKIYPGLLDIDITETDLSDLPLPATPIMLNLGNPELAFAYAHLPVAGVGLARMEFIINAIGVHPQALLDYEQLTDQPLKTAIGERIRGYESPQSYYVQSLAEGIATLAAAFYPKPVLVRFSDFKSNEYANLLGGSLYEPEEENPMIGYRGAARYIDADFAPSFALECQAIKQVREKMGLTNVNVMVPFCRRVNEAQAVVSLLNQLGIRSGDQGLKIYMMCEIPNNVLMMSAFAEYFDGFSIGSNDLTQLVLGVDRDSAKVAASYDERDPGVKKMLQMAIEQAQTLGKPIGICGQAPSDYPEMAEFLVHLGVSSMSLNPDSVLTSLPKILAAEQVNA